MTQAEQTRQGRHPAARIWTGALAVAVIVLVAATAGTLFGRAAGPANRPATAPPASPMLSGRGLSVVLPGGWTRVRPAALPGVPAGVAVAAQDSSLGTQLLLAMVPFTSPSLMPRQLADGVGEIPRPHGVGLAGGFTAYEYGGLSHPAVRGALDVLVAPTTAGVAMVACVSKEARSPSPDCSTAQISLVIRHARPLPLRATTAFAVGLPRALASLSAVRDRERAAVGRGDVPATLRLAAANRSAATALGALVPRGARRPERIVRALDAQAGAYERLATALRRGRRTAALRARRRIIAGEAALQGQLRRRPRG